MGKRHGTMELCLSSGVILREKNRKAARHNGMTYRLQCYSERQEWESDTVQWNDVQAPVLFRETKMGKQHSAIE